MTPCRQHAGNITDRSSQNQKHDEEQFGRKKVAPLLTRSVDYLEHRHE